AFLPRRNPAPSTGFHYAAPRPDAHDCRGPPPGQTADTSDTPAPAPATQTDSTAAWGRSAGIAHERETHRAQRRPPIALMLAPHRRARAVPPVRSGIGNPIPGCPFGRSGDYRPDCAK